MPSARARLVLSFLATFQVVPGTLRAQAAAEVPPVALYRTELHRLRSDRVGMDFQVRVRLPDSYAAAASASRRYPVVYLLDGDLLFGLAADVLQPLEWGRLVPEAIIVAPAYGSIHSPENGGTNMRARDFSVFPSQAGYVDGGGRRFLAFLREELRPFVEQRFRVDTADRTLVGFSRGADLAIFTLFTAPDAFSRYVAFDNFYPDYLQLERAFAATNRDLRARLFLSGRHPRARMSDLADSLRTRNYPGLSLEYIDSHPLHVAVPGDGITRGLISVFRK
jgi:predicted esterase